MSIARHLDIHVLHTVAYSNMNRDDLGSPKTVQYGGVTRTRVSSQSWKRAVRLDLAGQLADALGLTGDPFGPGQKFVGVGIHRAASS